MISTTRRTHTPKQVPQSLMGCSNSNFRHHNFFLNISLKCVWTFSSWWQKKARRQTNQTRISYSVITIQTSMYGKSLSTYESNSKYVSAFKYGSYMICKSTAFIPWIKTGVIKRKHTCFRAYSLTCIEQDRQMCRHCQNKINSHPPLTPRPICASGFMHLMSYGYHWYDI